MQKHLEIELDYLRSQEIEMIIELEERLSKFKCDCHCIMMNIDTVDTPLISAIIRRRPHDIFIEVEHECVKLFSRSEESLRKFQENIDKLK